MLALRLPTPLAESPHLVDLGRSRKPRLLDLFCGAGGAALGYHQAGFEIVGVDIKPQPRYPFKFIQGDALEIGREMPAVQWWTFDAIHASPPCQAFSVMKDPRQTFRHEDLIPPTRGLLEAMGLPYVIENVPGSPLRGSVMLCGSMFGLRSGRGYLRRHRYFEMNWSVSELLPPCQHVGLAIGVYGHGSAGHLGQRMRTANRDEARVLMGTPDMTRDGMSQAVPPAYTEWIGKQLLSVLDRSAEVPA